MGMNDLGEFWPQDFSNIIWSYATSGESHPKLFSKLGDHIIAMKDLGQFKPQDFSNIMWSYATAGEAHPKLFSKLGDHIVAIRTWDNSSHKLYPTSYGHTQLQATHISSIYLTCRGPSTPIHLIDAYTSQLRASYRTYNSVDCMEGPSIVSFNTSGSRIYGTGFKTDCTIAIFDTSIPGQESMIACMGKSRRSNDGQKGIPSAIAFPKNTTN